MVLSNACKHTKTSKTSIPTLTCKAIMIDADAIASAVLEEFSKLPAKRKPSVRDNGLHEWVPMAGIVAKGAARCMPRRNPNS